MKHDLFRVSVKWLDGGREDEFWVLAVPPLDLPTVADAIRNFQGGADELMHKMADEIEQAGEVRNAQVNSTTRFVGVNGTYQQMPVVVEIQSLPFVAIGIEFDSDPYARVVDLGHGKKGRR